MNPHRRAAFSSLIRAGILCALVLATSSSRAQDDPIALPQSHERVMLSAATRHALETELSGVSTSGRVSLSDGASGQIIASLPTPFRDSCAAMVLEGWGLKNRPDGAKATAQWSVRVLFFSRDAHGTALALALRCAEDEDTGTGPKPSTSWYDERPATLYLTPDSAALSLVPVAEDHPDRDAELYDIAFSQAYAVAGAQVVELKASYTDSNNPCCGGPMGDEGSRLIFVAFPDGEHVLSLNARDEYWTSPDDGSEGADDVCQSKLDYSRDGAGNVQTIRAETRCTANKKPKSDKTEIFKWDQAARRFDEVKGSVR